MRYTGYDPMAWLYARHWGSEYHEQGFGILKRLLLDGLEPGSAILDLCCGDGRITQQLSRAGFRVTGLDGSERMLEYARERAPGVDLVLADARDFELPGRFDAAVSTFDSLNHVMSPEELECVFRSVARVLRPGACFVFDLNREEAYTSLWATTYAMVQPEFVSVCLGGYDSARRTAHADFTLFRDVEGSWSRSDFRMTQFCHSAAQVLESLIEAGFDKPRVLDAAADLAMFGNIGKGRDYYVARRGG